MCSSKWKKKHHWERVGYQALQDTRSDVKVWRSLMCSMWMSNHLAGWSSAMNCKVSAVGSGRKPSGINVMSKRLWNPWGFGVKSVSITSGWPSSLVSKGYEFAASCVCPGSSHHTGRLGLLGTEARIFIQFSENTHQGCRASCWFSQTAAASPPWQGCWRLLIKWVPERRPLHPRRSTQFGGFSATSPMLLCSFLPSRWCDFIALPK